MELGRNLSDSEDSEEVWRSEKEYGVEDQIIRDWSGSYVGTGERGEKKRHKVV